MRQREHIEWEKQGRIYFLRGEELRRLRDETSVQYLSNVRPSRPLSIASNVGSLEISRGKGDEQEDKSFFTMLLNKWPGSRRINLRHRFKWV